MGKRGPQPTPTKVLEARGSWRALHRQDEPTPELKIPDAPDYFDVREQKLWDFYTSQLEKLGIIGEVDAHALAAYCQACVTLEDASRKVRENGFTIIQESGNKVKNPDLTAQEKAIDQIYRGAQLFGFCPSGRVGLKSRTQKEEKSDKSRFFKQGKTG